MYSRNTICLGIGIVSCLGDPRARNAPPLRRLDVAQAVHWDVVDQFWFLVRVEVRVGSMGRQSTTGKSRIDNMKNKCCTVGSVRKPVFARYLGFETNACTCTLNVMTTKIFFFNGGTSQLDISYPSVFYREDRADPSS